MCLNARSIVNNKNELNIMVENTDPDIIGTTEPYGPTKTYIIADAELGLTRYVMFMRDRIGRLGSILYNKEYIQAYKIN